MKTWKIDCTNHLFDGCLIVSTREKINEDIKVWPLLVICDAILFWWCNIVIGCSEYLTFTDVWNVYSFNWFLLSIYIYIYIIDVTKWCCYYSYMLFYNFKFTSVFAYYRWLKIKFLKAVLPSYYVELELTSREKLYNLPQ